MASTAPNYAENNLYLGCDSDRAFLFQSQVNSSISALESSGQYDTQYCVDSLMENDPNSAIHTHQASALGFNEMRDPSQTDETNSTGVYIPSDSVMGKDAEFSASPNAPQLPTSIVSMNTTNTTQNATQVAYQQRQNTLVNLETTDFAMYSSRFPGFDSLVPMMSMPVQQALAGNSGSEPTATALATRQRLRHVPSVRRPAPHYKTEALRVIKAETAAETALLHEDIVIQARLKRAIDMAEQEVRRLKDMVDTCTWRRVAKTQQN